MAFIFYLLTGGVMYNRVVCNKGTLRYNDCTGTTLFVLLWPLAMLMSAVVWSGDMLTRCVCRLFRKG